MTRASRALFAAAPLCLVAALASAAPPHPLVSSGVGVVFDTTVSTPYCEAISDFSSVQPVFTNLRSSSVLNIYILFYDTPSSPTWTTAQKNYMISFWGPHGLGASIIPALFSQGQNIKDDYSPLVVTTTNVAATYEDMTGAFGSACGAPLSAMSFDVVNGFLPNDPAGGALYLALGSDNQGSVCCTANSGYLIAGGPTQLQASAYRCSGEFGNYYWSPSGDPYFDGMVSATTFEGLQVLLSTYGNLTGTSHCAPECTPSTICLGSTGYGINTNIHWYDQLNVAPVFADRFNTPLNFQWTDTGVTRGAIVIPTFIGTQGGQCSVLTQPTFWNVACRKNADCPSYSGVCDPATGHCAKPNCHDGVQNEYELGVDIAGGCGSALGQACGSYIDCPPGDSCVSGVCTSVDGAPCLDQSYCTSTQWCCIQNPPNTGPFRCPTGTQHCITRQPCTTLADCYQFWAPSVTCCTNAGCPNCGNPYTSCTAGYCH